MFLEKVLMLIVGSTLVAGGGFIAKNSLDARNFIVAAMFGLLGIGVGTFLIACVFMGFPDW